MIRFLTPAFRQESLRIVRQVAPAAAIFTSIGLLVAAWAAAGVIPLLVVTGLDVVTPRYFLLGAALACGALSFATGTSWATVATLGVAMMGVARGLGVDPAAAAGAIVAGAHFGDKLSPLSETATLAATVAGARLYTHLRHTALTTVPAFVAALAVYALLAGPVAGPVGSLDQAIHLRQLISAHFALPAALWLPVALVLAAAVLQWPVVPSLLASALAAAALAVGVQGFPLAGLPSLFWYGYRTVTGYALLDGLLHQGGLWPMVQLSLAALGLFGLVAAILRWTPGRNLLAWLRRTARTPGRAVLLAVALSVLLMMASGSTYLTVLVVGELMRPAFSGLGLLPQNLSRTLEDAGTQVAPLVPWGVSGLFMANTLGVGVLDFGPYAVSNYLGFLIAIAYGFTGWFLPRWPVSPPGQGEAAAKMPDRS